MRVAGKLQCIGVALQPLGQQPSQQPAAEQVLLAAPRLAYGLPCLPVGRGEQGLQQSQLLGVDLCRL